jgi:hypothetical protein
VIKNLEILELYEKENFTSTSRRVFPSEYCWVIVANGYFTGKAFTGDKKMVLDA